jgi:hypothetical protein
MARGQLKQQQHWTWVENMNCHEIAKRQKAQD